jgi:hypothetical protein
VIEKPASRSCTSFSARPDAESIAGMKRLAPVARISLASNFLSRRASGSRRR